MSGIAEVLLNLGYAVSGSDLKRSAVTDRLAALGARIFEGHAAENVAGAHVVVTSTAVRAGQPRGRGGAPARRPRDPARGDAGRADAPEVRRGGGGQPRQDHDHVDGRPGAGPRRARSHGGGGRPPGRARLRRAPGQGRLHGGGGRRVRPLVPEALAHHGGRHQHRPRAPRHLPRPGRRPGRLRRLREQGALLRRGRALPRRRAGAGRPAADRAPRGHLRALAAGARSPRATCSSAPPARSYTAVAHGQRAGPVELRVPGRAQRPQLAGRGGGGPRPRRALRAASAPGSTPSPASTGASRCAARRAA